MCIKDLQTQVTSLLSIKEKTKANTDCMMSSNYTTVDVKAQKVKCQISHIIFVI